jgi:predicted  nucleic acid-binding Zn-ribbon protein
VEVAGSNPASGTKERGMSDREQLRQAERRNADLRIEILALRQEILELKEEIRCVRQNQKALVRSLEHIQAVLEGAHKTGRRRFVLRG